MKKVIYTLSILLALGLSANAQIEKLAGPRLGLVYISPSPSSSFLNGDLALGDDLLAPAENGAFTSLYGWQWESRFADGGEVTGIVEWIVLAGGMERGKFLPSVSSLVGARSASGLEFAVGPNLSLTGIGMVVGIGYNFKSGNLNLPVNIAFVPGRTQTQEAKEAEGGEAAIAEFDYNRGSKFSITVGFNLSK